MELIVEARGLVKTYGAAGNAVVPALRGVDFGVPRGELVAIMGPSGCGKSTLLNILGGLDRPTSGELFLSGQRVDDLSEAQWAVLRRKRIGFVFQFFNLIGNLTVAGNVELPALLAGVSPGEARTRASQLLERLGIAAKATSVPALLSGGERQRVALARALINQPTLLLADEPTGNLDSANTSEVLALLRRCHDDGQTIVLVTHDPDVARIADRLVTMRDGQIVEEQRMPAITRAHEVVAAASAGREEA